MMMSGAVSSRHMPLNFLAESWSHIFFWWEVSPTWRFSPSLKTTENLSLQPWAEAVNTEEDRKRAKTQSFGSMGALGIELVTMGGVYDGRDYFYKVCVWGPGVCEGNSLAVFHA